MGEREEKRKRPTGMGVNKERQTVAMRKERRRKEKEGGREKGQEAMGEIGGTRHKAGTRHSGLE